MKSDMKNKNKRKNTKTFGSRSKRRAAAKRDALRKTARTGTDPTARMPQKVGRGARFGAPMSEVGIGVFSAAKSGIGFVRIETLSYDVFIPERDTGGAIEGDTVEVRYRVLCDAPNGERAVGRVVRIVDGVQTLIGTLIREPTRSHGRDGRGSRLCLMPDDRRIRICPTVTQVGSAEVGDKVKLLLRRTPTLCGEVIAVFGAAQTRAANYAAILDECGIESAFSEEEIAAADEAAARPISYDGRRTLDREVIFTIDGEGAKDLDDAISLRALPGGRWLLGVHIADVSAYVEKRTPLDRAAMARGTSVYFVDRVVPMLPPALSNGACSLNAGEEKLTISAHMTLAPDGTLEKTVLEPTVIRSRVRGVYSEINDLFERDRSSKYYKKYSIVYKTLVKMKKLATVLRERSAKRGALDLETSESKILLDANGSPIEVRRESRGFAEEMIEQFMLCANEGVATLLAKSRIPCVYRIHEPPPADKMRDLLTYLSNLAFDIRGIRPDRTDAHALAAVLEEAARRDLSEPVSYMMLRSLSKARYSEQNSGHFGLGIALYCHFTSPIRRLADLVTHRIIHKVLFEGEPPQRYADQARRAAILATEAELRAVTAERRIDALYKALYMERHVDECFRARVSSVTAFGVFAELDNTCEGLIPIGDLPGVFFFDEKTLTLRSRDLTYRPGDRLTVRVEQVDVIGGKIRFSDVRDENGDPAPPTREDAEVTS